MKDANIRPNHLELIQQLKKKNTAMAPWERGGKNSEEKNTHYFWAAIPAGVLKAGLSLLVGSVSETGVFNLPLDMQKQHCFHKAHILHQSPKTVRFSVPTSRKSSE